ncbi:N-6 DNA methylase [Streptomyces prunicolor]|uniref:N-6 DNA methylase n=1 Tax=Streptomyces prunicolor TaxID=67348 RepID=UPI00036BC903|nr:N-6 DNA methylase [Streptomyces prunicolor]
MDIPCGVVAALALWPHKTPGASHAADLARYLASQPALRWPPTVGQVAAVHYLHRPDLIGAAGLLLRWAEEEHDADTLYAVKAVAETALKHGVLLHTGSADPAERSEVDLMSWSIVCLRHGEDRSWLAEHHTPDDATDVLVALAIGDRPPASASVNEPAGGTGGIFRAAAQRLRDHGVDPRDWTWSLQDLDPLAVAGAAVNFLVWDLGPNATVACGNTLSEGDLTGQALAVRARAESRRDALLAGAEQAAGHLRALRALGVLE